MIKELGYYVYRLLDPRNGETFYVGKGKGNRVFNHVKLAKSENLDKIDDKTKLIQEIINKGLEVIIVIHRHKLTEETAFHVEAALIDAYPNAKNRISGYDNTVGVMHAKEITDKYKMEEADIRHKIIMITINTSILETSVYDATRFAWRLRKKKLNRQIMSLVSKTVLLGVFSKSKNGKKQVSKTFLSSVLTYPNATVL